MQYMYTAILSPMGDQGKYAARVPDVPGCATTGANLADAIAQITDALSGCLVVLEDEGLPLPPATPQAALSRAPSDVCTLVQVDTVAYRARTDTRSVRKNVSLPAWMAALAEQRGLNCSRLLQEAILQRLA